MRTIKWVGREARHFIRDEDGATAIEYALLAAIMGVGIVGSLDLLVDALNAAITFVEDAIVGVL